MLAKLEDYYRSEGILATEFSCPHKDQCSDGCDDFTGPKSAFVSTGYDSHLLLRLLFLSLDSGMGDNNDLNRLPIAVRYANEHERETLTLPKHKHWYRTHELAWYILKKFKPDLEIQHVKHYFAHANSAKCCMNKKQKRKADKILFKNCQQYFGKELEILDPIVIISQGNEAKFAVQAFTDQTIRSYDEFAQIIEIHGKSVFWLHTYHPNNWGAFNRQRQFNWDTNIAEGWIRYADKIRRFVNTQ